MGFAAPQSIHRFRKSEDGAIAIIFALTAFIVFLITGLAIDFGRAFHANSAISAAIDSAALAAARGVRQENLTEAEATELARKMFELNMRGRASDYADIKRFSVNVDRAKASVQIDVDADVPTIFSRVAGFEKVSLPVTTTAIMKSQDIEVGLQLDVTGSMSGQKIVDLKVATKDLIDILIPNQPGDQKVRIGLAPFSAGVNAGRFARAVNGNRDAPRNCVYERQDDGAQATENLPVGTSRLKIRTDLGNVNWCPNALVQPLTDDKALLKSTVDGFAAGGSTAGHLGTAWAWYLISPVWQGIWNTPQPIADYNDGRTIKVAVLMTDGEYNTVGGVMSAANEPRSAKFAKDTCAEMRRKGVIIYTVGFQLGGHQGAIETLNSCAGDASRALLADNGEQLRAAFRSIAQDITSLRLAR